MNDLVILVPDKNVESGISSLLCRCDDLSIHQISYKIVRHPERDPGVYHNAVDLLRPFMNQCKYALVFIDHEGSGKEDITQKEIADHIKNRLNGSGWKDRSEVIVFEPELEIWVWVDSPYTAKILGWDSYLELRDWLAKRGFWEEDLPKPLRPKEVLEKALREKRIPRSSSIYGDIANKVNLDSCKIQSFNIFKGILRKWFPA